MPISFVNCINCKTYISRILSVPDCRSFIGIRCQKRGLMTIQTTKMMGSTNDEAFCKIQQGDMMILMHLSLPIPVRKTQQEIPAIYLNLQTPAKPVTGSSDPSLLQMR